MHRRGHPRWLDQPDHHYTYTANDQVDVERNPRGYATKHVYDANGNETSTITNCTTSGTTVPTRNTSCTAAGTHDATTNVTTSATFALATRDGKAGLPGTTTDALGAVTTNTYDVIGRQTIEVLPGDATIPVLTRTTVFDEYDAPLTLTESWPGLSPSRVTTSVYDLRGQLLTETNPAGEVTSSTYDAAGDATSSTANGVTTANTVDGMGNVISEVTGGVTTAHTYDGRSVKLASTGAGADVTLTVDGITRPTNRKVGSGVAIDDKQDLTTVAGHIKISRKVGAGYVLQTDATQDRLGRQVALATGPTSPLIQTSTFDANGNETRRDRAGGEWQRSMDDHDDTTHSTGRRRHRQRRRDLPGRDERGPHHHHLLRCRGPGRRDQGSARCRDTDLLQRSRPAVEVVQNCTDTGTTAPSNPATCAGTGTHRHCHQRRDDDDLRWGRVRDQLDAGLSTGSNVTASTYDAVAG